MPYLNVTRRTIEAAVASTMPFAATPAPHRSLVRSLTDHDPFPQAITKGLAGTATPSDAALQSLKDFVRAFYFVELGTAAEIQLLATACFIAVVLLIGVVLVGYRLYHKRFWVFRFMRRAEGIYIVPNALNCFLLLEGTFGILLICYNTITWQVFHKDVARHMDGILLWSTLTWIPLYIGAFWAGWGSFYTASGTLDRTNSLNRGRADRILGLVPKPLFINLVCLGTPLLLVASVVPPAVLAQRQLTRSYRDYLDWARYADGLSLGAGTLTGASARTALDRASALWNSVGKSYFYVDISYAVWGFWALVFLAFYIPAGGYLVYLLWKQVQKQKALFIANLQQAAAAANRDGRAPSDGSDINSGTTARPSNVAVPTAATGAVAGGSPKKAVFNIVTYDAPNRFQRLALPDQADEADAACMRRPEQASQDSSTAVPEDGLSPPNSPLSCRPPRRTVKEEVRDVFFPPLRPDFKRQATRRLSSHASPSLRFKYLRRCMINLIILDVGIIAAAIMFSYVTIRLAAGMYESMIHGPQQRANLWREGQLVASYASCIFGFLTVGSIVLRSFDSEAPLRDHGSKGSGNRGNKKRARNNDSSGSTNNDGRHGGDGGRGANIEDKTRTLPAVPESVGVETTQHDVSKPQWGGELVSGIKFSLGTDSVHPGALVLRPDDPLASTASVTPETEQGPFARQQDGLTGGSPQLFSGGSSPRVAGNTDGKPFRKHGNIFAVRGNRPWVGSNAKIVEEANESPARVESEALHEQQPPTPQVFYPTPYGVVAGPSSSNRHGSLRTQPNTPQIGRTTSQNSLAQIATIHAQEQHEQQQQQQQQMLALPRTRQPAAVNGMFEPADEEVIKDGDVEEVAEARERSWLRRSSRSGAADTTASQIAREWQASQYMNAPLLETPTSTPPPPSSSSFVADLPLYAPSTPSRVPQIRSALARKVALVQDGHGEVSGSPCSARSMQISQAEAILTGAASYRMLTPPRTRRPTLPLQHAQQQRGGSEIMTGYALSAPFEPLSPMRTGARRTATASNGEEGATSAMASPSSTRSQRLALSPAIFF